MEIFISPVISICTLLKLYLTELAKQPHALSPSLLIGSENELKIYLSKATPTKDEF